MNKQRKVVITITYNEMGIIIDTKAEELGSSAQPERKPGKWTVKNGELAFWDVCSECGRMVMHKAPFYNFCPHCGADMRGEQSGSV